MAPGSSPETVSFTIDAISPLGVTAARNSPRNTGMPFRRCSRLTHFRFPVGFAYDAVVANPSIWIGEKPYSTEVTARKARTTSSGGMLGAGGVRNIPRAVITSGIPNNGCTSMTSPGMYCFSQTPAASVFAINAA